MNTTIIIGIVVTVIILIIISIVLVVMFTSKKKDNTTNQKTQPIVSATGSIETAPDIAIQSDPVPALINFVKDTNKIIAWKGMKYKTDQDLRNLNYLVSCDRPWDAYYKIGCTLGGKTIYTNPYGPVSDGTKQGPDIRIAPDDKDNYCAQLGGKLSVIRQRPGDKEMLDITDYLQNSDTTGPYNGIDPVFVDNYLTDC